MQSARRVLEDGVTWTPRHDSHHIVAGMMVSAREAPPVCILQSVLGAVEAQLERAEGPFGYGVLTGRPYRCPRTQRHYVLVDGAHECAPLPPRSDERAALALGLSDRIAELERARHVVAGFYRGGARLAPRVAPADIELLRSLFGEPWQLMLLRSARESTAAGAVVRIEPIYAQAYAAPFVELLPRRRRRAGAGVPSAITWESYQPSEPVAPLPPAPVRAASGVRAASEGDARSSIAARLATLAADAIRRLAAPTPTQIEAASGVAAPVPVPAPVRRPPPPVAPTVEPSASPVTDARLADTIAPPVRAAPTPAPVPVARDAPDARSTSFPIMVPPVEEDATSATVPALWFAVAAVLILLTAGAALTWG